jgi:hypothetical protein
MKIWLRPLPFALAAAALVVVASRAPVDDAAASRSAALCAAMAHDGMTCAAADVVWLDGPSGVLGSLGGARARALVRARTGAPGAVGDATTSESFDVLAVRARLSPEGQLLDLGDVHDLTHTASADEGLPIVRGSLVAYVVEIDGRPEAVHVLDLAGRDRRLAGHRTAPGRQAHGLHAVALARARASCVP